MASRPGLLTHWPWEKLGNFKYVILTPWVVHSLYTVVKAKDWSEIDITYMLVVPSLLLRMLHNQLWISYSRFQNARSPHLIVDKPIEFEQVDRERTWDDQVLFNGILFYIGYTLIPSAKFLPGWSTDGFLITIIAHTGPVEFLYYWFHRALHHHYLYSRYHSHHHASIVTEPITSVIHPFAEHIIYFLLFSIPILTSLFVGKGSLITIVGYIPDSAVSIRIASIVASKRRRLAGKRRSCEGMCYTLPTPDDPFNDRLDAEPLPKKKAKKPPPLKKPNKADPKAAPLAEKSKKVGGGDTLSKFFILCLKAIQATWEEEGSTGGETVPPLMTSRWGAEFCRRCCTGMSVVDTSGVCASNEQVAWLVSMAADKIAIKEKQGLSFSNPFLIYLVPSQEKAIQVRSVCKPLKALGIHTVSLHPGAALDHQVCGLKSCEPEFLVSTPERLLELVSVGAIGISGTSLLVLDGLKDFIGSGFQDKVKTIRESISGDTQIVIFGDCFGKEYAALVQNLLRGPMYRLSQHGSVVSQSAFISQHVHLCMSAEEKLPKALQILREASNNKTTYRDLKVLFITLTASKAKILAYNLKAEGFSVPEHFSTTESCSGAEGVKAAKILVKDIDAVRTCDIEEFELVIFMDFPSSIDDYVAILTKMARYSVSGVLHSFFRKTDAPLAQSLAKVLEQCRQEMPQPHGNFDSS